MELKTKAFGSICADLNQCYRINYGLSSSLGTRGNTAKVMVFLELTNGFGRNCNKKALFLPIIDHFC